MRNKRLRSFLSDFNQISSRLACKNYLATPLKRRFHFSGTCRALELLLEVELVIKTIVAEQVVKSCDLDAIKLSGLKSAQAFEDCGPVVIWFGRTS